MLGRPGRRTFEPSYFLRNERPIPPQDRVRCDDAGDACQPTPAEDLAFHGEAAALVVGEGEPSASVRCAQNPVLLEQVVNDRLLPPVDPAGEDENDEGKRRRQRVHGASVPREAGSRQDSRDSRSCVIAWGRIPKPCASDCVEYTGSSTDFASAEFSHRTGCGDISPWLSTGPSGRRRNRLVLLRRARW